MTVICHYCGGDNYDCCKMQSISPFAKLKITPTIELTLSQIETAFYQAITTTHPDKIGGDGVDAADINQAYHLLCDKYQLAKAVYQRATGKELAEITNDIDVLSFAMEIADYDNTTKIKYRNELWQQLIVYQINKNWDEYIKTLLKYRYVKL